jgi:hypothetical protein
MNRGFLVACILLFGCTTQPIQDVHKGAFRTQVIALLGKPDGSQRSGEYEALRYTNRIINGSSSDRADYNVILQAGFVIDYGYGYIRQPDPSVNNKLILVPLKVDTK